MGGKDTQTIERRREQKEKKKERRQREKGGERKERAKRAKRERERERERMRTSRYCTSSSRACHLEALHLPEWLSERSHPLWTKIVHA
jgi:hypothetical protein